jgi:hypothetical protein
MFVVTLVKPLDGELTRTELQDAGAPAPASCFQTGNGSIARKP